MYVKLAGVTFGKCQSNIRKMLGPNPILKLVREPRNKYDPNAVSVRNKGRHIGYLSRQTAETVSKYLDSGEKIICEFGRLNRYKIGQPIGVSVLLFNKDL